MKNILLIGVGGTGSRAVDIFYKKYNEFGKHNDNHITALVFDTDAGDISNIQDATAVAMADNASVGTICDRLGKSHLREWFPCDDMAIRSQEMIRGASQWRKKSYLAFLNLMNKPLARAKLIGALDKMVADPGSGCEVYVISSVAGGTGSGSFIPIALFVKRYLRKNLGKDPIVNAMIALPEIYADAQTPENRVKIFANAYAILRELNAINLVARNYNEGRSEQKKAPIKFRIGHPDEPNLGVLFDASDRRFWTPEAAPFSQVFLLDKIPGLNSITAHDIVLANSLYAILCTDIGAQFDSEFSNHELLRSQNNGSNAIYAGISTAQIKFPKETILEYLAHKKTLDACDSEWMVLHTAVENEIREKEDQAREIKRRYQMKDGEYAEIVLKLLEKWEDDGACEDIIALIDRGTAIYEEEGKKSTETTVDAYFEQYLDSIKEKIPSSSRKLKVVESMFQGTSAKPKKDAILQKVHDLSRIFLDYFKNCVEEVKSVTTSTADAALTLDKRKQDYAHTNLSIEEKLLKKDGKYIHPVAALVQLCRLRAKITEELEMNIAEWDEFRMRSISTVPMSLLEIEAHSNQGGEPINYSKSFYFKLGKTRFKDVQTRGDIKKARTDAKADLQVLSRDAVCILNNIEWGAQQQLQTKVLKLLAANVDLLISKYRAFFNRFEKEKESLIEDAKTAERRDNGIVDSSINVYSSIADKKEILKLVLEEGGPVTESEVLVVDDVVGKGVFENVYRSAIAAASKDNNWNDKDSGAFRSLFGSMVASYREFLFKNETFQNIASYNAVEAIVASCGNNREKIEQTLRENFAMAQELAKPSLRVNETGDLGDLVTPSTITVFMMSLNTAKYIKRHAEEFALHLPADQTNEYDVIKSCSEEFIRTYSGNTGARVVIVSSVSDQVLYCTGEIMDITPLRISKFDEVGPDNLYYREYRKSVANQRKYNTDMWNPHLGYDLHKRGYLPYMNESKEHECDTLVVKAILYAFSKNLITYNSGVGEARERYYFMFQGKHLTDPDGKWINNKNIAQLLAWMRNEDELVEEWSAEFEKEINQQKMALPNIASDTANEIAALESALTISAFMRMLTDCLYEDPSEQGKACAKKVKYLNGKPTLVERRGPTVFEFAYLVKTSEEVGRDCDDAERILSVVYEVFRELCEFRTNPESAPERFIQVYRQQLENIYKSLAGSKIVCGAGSDCRMQFTLLTNWLHETHVFDNIPTEMPMDDRGNVVIDRAFAPKGTDVVNVLDYITAGFKAKKKEEEDSSEEPQA